MGEGITNIATAAQNCKLTLSPRMNQIRGHQFLEMMRNSSLRDRKLSDKRFAWNLVMAGDCRQDGEPLGIRDRLGDSLVLTFVQLYLCGYHSSNLGILGITGQHRCQKKKRLRIGPRSKWLVIQRCFAFDPSPSRDAVL